MPRRKRGNKSKQQQQQQPKGKRRPRAAVPRAMPLEPTSLDYAKLLLDPCGAKLTHPVYAGGEGGYLVRTESVNQVFFGTGVTGGVFHWTPGAINSDNTEQLWANSPSIGPPSPISTQSGSPGKAFLANASVVRCVAACLKICYSGAESARSGRIYYGRSSGGLVSVGDVVAAEVLAGALPHFTRTPVGDIEVLWVPNDADQLFVNPNATLSEEDRKRKASITVAANVLPPGEGLIVRQTAIYEWQPKQTAGIAVPANSRARTNNTLDQVLNYVQGVLNGAASRAGAAAGLAGRSALAGMMGSMYGIIPAIPMRREGPALIGY